MSKYSETGKFVSPHLFQFVLILSNVAAFGTSTRSIISTKHVPWKALFHLHKEVNVTKLDELII